jgi:hypothetical protein
MCPAPPTPRLNPALSIDAHGIGWLVFDDPHRVVNILAREVGLRRAGEVILSGRRFSSSDAVSIGMAHAALPARGFRNHLEHQAHGLALAMINEASRILEDEDLRAGAVDLAMVAGGGFPAFRGGPLHYADTLGLDLLLSRFQELSEDLGPRFSPSLLLADLVREGHTFYSRFP